MFKWLAGTALVLAVGVLALKPLSPGDGAKEIKKLGDYIVANSTKV